MQKNIYLICNFFLIIIFISCNTKVENNNFKNEDFKFQIYVPSSIDIQKDNFVKIYNYTSKFDSIKDERYPIVYFFIEDTIVSEKSNILQITSDNKIKFAEFYIYDESFKIPHYLFKNKKGKQKLSVAILDISLKDTIKKSDNNNFKEDQINMSILECRANYDIFIK